MQTDSKMYGAADTEAQAPAQEKKALGRKTIAAICLGAALSGAAVMTAARGRAGVTLLYPTQSVLKDTFSKDSAPGDTVSYGLGAYLNPGRNQASPQTLLSGYKGHCASTSDCQDGLTCLTRLDLPNKRKCFPACPKNGKYDCPESFPYECENSAGGLVSCASADKCYKKINPGKSLEKKRCAKSCPEKGKWTGGDCRTSKRRPSQGGGGNIDSLSGGGEKKDCTGEGCMCPMMYAPVCAEKEDEKTGEMTLITYSNACAAECVCAKVLVEQECE